jgi:hypothetical protein
MGDFDKETYALRRAGEDQRVFQQKAYDFGVIAAEALGGMEGFELNELTTVVLFWEFVDDMKVDDGTLAFQMFEKPFREGWEAYQQKE